MVKLTSGLLLPLLSGAALLQGACAHMKVISPSPRNGAIKDELNKPCGGINTPTKNITTFDANSSDSEFILRPSHGTGNLIFNYYTDLTVTNNTKSFPLDNVPIPTPGTYKTKLDFSKAGLKNGQSIVVQAIYNGTDHGETEEYYACFDIKLAPSSNSGSESESEPESDSKMDSNTDSMSASTSMTKTESSTSSETSDHTSGAVSLVTAGVSAALGLLVAVGAAAF